MVSFLTQRGKMCNMEHQLACADAADADCYVDLCCRFSTHIRYSGVRMQ